MIQPSLFPEIADSSSPFTFSDATLGYDEAGAPIYRYDLIREWESENPRTIVWCLLNPSTADAFVPDPTVTRVFGYSRAWGFGRFVVVNLFAFRATEPTDMKKASDPVGPENNQYIVKWATQAELFMCGWGNDGAYLKRSIAVRSLLRDLGVRAHCLSRTRKGEPGHPLYLRSDLTPQLMEDVQ